MDQSFVKELLKTLVTLSLTAAAMFVGVPLAIFGSLWLHEFLLGGFYRERLIVALLAIGAAGFTFWLSSLWLAWCGGRLKRFTLRRMFLATTLLAIYMGLIAILLSDAHRTERLRREAPPPPNVLRFL